MIHKQVPKTSKKLGKILFLISLCGCAGMPKVTLNQLDTKYAIANPFKIVNYNEKTCSVEVEEQPSFPILGEQLHGGVCLNAVDFAKVKKKMQDDCNFKHHGVKVQSSTPLPDFLN